MATPLAEPTRLLIVDDNETYLALVSAELADLGHPIETARSVAEAAAKIPTGRYTAVLMDYCLGDGDATDVLRRLPPATGHDLRILLVTAMPSESSMWRDAQAKLERIKAEHPTFSRIALIPKPAELPQLREIASSLIRGAAPK